MHLLNIFLCHSGYSAEPQSAVQCERALLIWSSSTQGQAQLSGVMTAEYHDTRWLKPWWRTKCDSKKTAKGCCVHLKEIKALILTVPSTARVHCKLRIIEGWKKSFEETCHFPLMHQLYDSHFVIFFPPWFVLYQSSPTVNKIECFQKL